MAKAAKSTALAAVKPGAVVVGDWESELQAFAVQTAATEASQNTSRMISLKAGMMMLGGNPVSYKGVPNKLGGIVIDYIFENDFYDFGAYDPDSPQPPVCFAYAEPAGEDVLENMAPHAESEKPQHTGCKGCQWNEYGTAKDQHGNAAKGKACKNIRRLAIIPFDVMLDANGNMNKNLDEIVARIKRAEVSMMKLPVTSTTAWASYVRAIGMAEKAATFAVGTIITVMGDVKTQIKVTFEMIPGTRIAVKAIGQAILEKRAKGHDDLRKPYQPLDEEEFEQKKPAKGAAKAPVKGAKKQKFAA